MGIRPPFLYDAVGRESINNPSKEFDFKASPRANLASSPPRAKYEIPLVNSTRNSFASASSPTRKSFASTSSPTRKTFDSVPRSRFESFDSYSFVPSGSTVAQPMKPSTKMAIIRMRIIQLVLRCLELLGSVGLLVITILISNIPSKIGLIIRIPIGVAILHTTYGIFHMAGRPSGRTPGSSASYMLFAACFDISLIPFYAFTAILSESQHNMSLSGTAHSNEWSTLLSEGQSLLPKFSETAFLLAVVTGGLHLISLCISIYLAVIFRKITNLPPDMNPLEDNLTSRHKKSTSSNTSLSASQRRLSEPLESKRSSGAPYENLLRPPTVPYQSRTGSVDSFSTYHPTPPPSPESQSQSQSRDLPSRKYQITPSPRSSLGLQTQIQDSVQTPSSSSPKRSSYTAVSLTDDNPEPERIHMTRYPLRSSTKQKDAWFASDSLVKTKKPPYEPIAQQSFDDFDFSFPTTSSHPSKVNSNYLYHQANHSPPRSSHNILPNRSYPYAHLENKQPTPSALSERNFNRGTRDITSKELANTRIESHDYSSLKLTNADSYSNSKSNHNSKNRDFTDNDSLRGKYYGDLKPGTPPIMVGAKRQISTGADVQTAFRVLDRRQREVSGKLVEEGRASGVWSERFRRVSGRA